MQAFASIRTRKPAWILGTVLAIITLMVVWAYNRLVITTFDESYAISLGINVAFWQYYIMGGVSLSTVVSFESVGAVLVIAFLVGPPATAYLITENLKKTIFASIFFGITASIRIVCFSSNQKMPPQLL